MASDKKPTNPIVHVVQGGGGLLLGVVLLFTPFYEWGIIITAASAIFFLYGLAKYSSYVSQQSSAQQTRQPADDLAKLVQLRESGAISEEEYAKKKEELLRRI
jgi:uncharacterized membrane protein